MESDDFDFDAGRLSSDNARLGCDLETIGAESRLSAWSGRKN